MGLPLYVPPVESDLRRKSAAAAAAAASRDALAPVTTRVHRPRHRNAESLRESRRRAILSAAAAHASPAGSAVPAASAATAAAGSASTALLHEASSQQRHQMHMRLMELRQPQSEDEAQENARRVQGNLELGRIVHRILERQGANGDSQDGSDSIEAAHISSLGPSSRPLSAVFYPGIRQLTEAEAEATATAALTSSNDDEFNRQLLAVFGERHPPIGLSRNHPHFGGPEDEGAESADDAEDTAAMSRGGAAWMVVPPLGHSRPNADSVPPARHRTINRRYQVVLPPPDGIPQPTVDRPRHRGRASRRTSRIFGDLSTIQTPSGAGVSINAAGELVPGMTPETLAANAARQRYMRLNARRAEYIALASRNPSLRRRGLPSIEDLLSDTPIDGLGDRRRSLSPEGDGVWDTLRTTLTPDPHPPSVNTSFASSSSALAAAGTATAAPAAQPAPPAVPSPATRHEHDEEDAPVLVETSPPLATAAAAAAQDATASAGGALSGTATSASATASTSTSTSASASQQMQASPFTVVSVDADTADESVVLDGGVAEPGCDDEGAEDEDYDDEADYEGSGVGAQQETMLRALAGRRAPPQSVEVQQAEEALQEGLRRALEARPGAPFDMARFHRMQSIVRGLAQREDTTGEW